MSGLHQPKTPFKLTCTNALSRQQHQVHRCTRLLPQSWGAPEEEAGPLPPPHAVRFFIKLMLSKSAC